MVLRKTQENVVQQLHLQQHLKIMTVYITLSVAGSDSGPFDLYSNIDGYTSAFESGIDKIDLIAGYASALVPDYTTIIRVKSNNILCTNYVDINVETTTTTTTTIL